MKSKKVLITGATGFIGANLAKRLFAEKYEVHILIRKNSDIWRLKNFISKLNVHFVDLKEREKLFETIEQIQPEIIFHLASQVIHLGFNPEYKDLIENNFISTINLIDACDNIDYECFINTGTSSEYGLKGKPMQEDMVCNPINIYGITKNAATKYGQFIAKTKNKPIISLRIFSPYGPYDQKDRLITQSIVKALRNENLNLTNPTSVRDYIFIDDIVDLYIKSINHAKKFKGEIFNVGTGIQKNVKMVVENIIKITKSQSQINWGGRGKIKNNNQIWVADIKKTKKAFNWKPTHNLEGGLKKTIKWFENILENED